MQVKCVIAGINPADEADFTFVIVECTQKEKDAGIHCLAAANWAKDTQFGDDVIVYDDDSPATFLFEHFIWGSASVINCAEYADDGERLEKAEKKETS